ncbi:hypothetical protein S245_029648, partial [Arachis hypogaea]
YNLSPYVRWLLQPWVIWMGSIRGSLLQNKVLRIKDKSTDQILQHMKSSGKEHSMPYQNDEEFQDKGIYCPKGVLLDGPPGTGNLLAKAIAGEAGLPFFAANGTDFVEMFVGVAASRVKDLFLLPSS